MNAIELNQVTKTYPGFTLGPISLTLPSGCVMGLIGENGAGKSTAIKLMLDMIRRDSGTVSLLGKDPRKDPLIREDIGVVMDEVGFPGCLNARQIEAVLRRCYRRWDSDAYTQLLHRFHVPCDKPFKAFSRGNKMKLGLAAALSHHARLLLLDEATSGLDPVVRDELLDLFLDFTRDESHSILLSSHIVSDLDKVCDYAAFLHKGRLLLCEEKDRLCEAYALVHGTAEQLSALPTPLGMRRTPYGAEAIVPRASLPAGMEGSPVELEQLFIWMVKEAE